MVLNDQELKVFPDSKALTLAVAQRIADLANRTVRDHGVFAIALSGGSTPSALYRLMATNETIRSQIPWGNIHFFFGDERHVPPEHSESNFRMANEAMFQALPKKDLHIHRILAELASAAEAAEQYEADLKEFFGSRGLVADGFPRFDLILLGMGPDGHTASLFPNSSGLRETSRRVIANWVEKFKTDRITVTFPVLNSAAEVIVLAAGEEKASILAKVLNREGGEYPIQTVRPIHGIKRWMVDASAAAEIRTLATEAHP